jgi:hypothetical protein
MIYNNSMDFPLLTGDDATHTFTTVPIGILIPSRDNPTTLLIDTPGISNNEDMWWSYVINICPIDAAILFVDAKGRNSGYGVFSLIYSHVDIGNHPFKLFYKGEDIKSTSGNMCVSGKPRRHLVIAESRDSSNLIPNPSKIDELRQWINDLPRNRRFEIFKPEVLIQKLQSYELQVQAFQTD